MKNKIVKNLGPLAALAGVWEGDQGIDISPGRKGFVETAFREKVVFGPLGPVENRAQVLYGLRYSTTAWPLDADDPFHEETGCWLWDAEAEVE